MFSRRYFLFDIILQTCPIFFFGYVCFYLTKKINMIRNKMTSELLGIILLPPS